LLGLFLVVSPWLVGFRDAQAASWNAWICGLAIGALAIAVLNELYEWEEWTDVTLGLWTAVAPWLARGSAPRARSGSGPASWA
jgi:SPW repeat